MPSRSVYGLPQEAVDAAAQSVLANRWVPKTHQPMRKQMLALLSPHREVFFGGAAGGGKSDLLLAGALQYADVPGYSAIIFRKRYTDLALPGALMDRAHNWLGGTAAKWSGQNKQWRFPSGATLQFGYMDTDQHHQRYQSAEFQYVGWDELSHWATAADYEYLFSRCRRTATMSWVPLRVRSASNPGGPGHQWLFDRFLKETHPERLFIPAKLSDNTEIDQEEYRKSLAYLDEFRRKQLEDGNWQARPPGELFDRGDFGTITHGEYSSIPPDLLGRPVRVWDLAGSDPNANPRADWMAGLKMQRDGWGRYIIQHMKRFRGRPSLVEQHVASLAEADGYDCRVRMHQDPGQAGVHQIETYQTHVVCGYNFEGLRESGTKWVRAQPLAGAVGAGLVLLLEGDWHSEFFAEYEAFSPNEKDYAWDDQVDAGSTAFNVLSQEAVPGRAHPLASLTDAEIEQVTGHGASSPMVTALRQEMHARGWLDAAKGISLSG